MKDKIYSTVDELSSKARSRFSGNGQGENTLTAIIILSGVLSAIFFWTFSRQVFVNVWPPAALALGLVVGILPAEGAFFGWRRVLSTKQDLTKRQLGATKTGLVAAVACGIFSTLALFVATVPFVPADIKAHADWLVFLALAVPTPLQVGIIAWFGVNERGTVENYERAKLGAMGFDAWIKAEQARMQAIIDGIDAALDAKLASYGQDVGDKEADRILTDGQQQLLGMSKVKDATAPADATPQNGTPSRPTPRPGDRS